MAAVVGRSTGSLDLTQMRGAAIGVAIAVALQSIAHAGPTQVTDHGIATTPRYTADLGRVDLSKPGQYSYLLEGLPAVEFTIGLTLDEPPSIQRSTDRVPPATQLRLSLISAEGLTVISEQGKLGEWTTSFAREGPQSFIYRRGEQSESQQTNGFIKLTRIRTKADGGWGTYFTPRPGVRYSLVVEIIEPTRENDRNAHLTLQGGGWK